MQQFSEFPSHLTKSSHTCLVPNPIITNQTEKYIVFWISCLATYQTLSNTFTPCAFTYNLCVSSFAIFNTKENHNFFSSTTFWNHWQTLGCPFFSSFEIKIQYIQMILTYDFKYLHLFMFRNALIISAFISYIFTNCLLGIFEWFIFFAFKLGNRFVQPFYRIRICLSFNGT